MMRSILLTVTLLCLTLIPSSAQSSRDSVKLGYTEEYLDTVDVSKTSRINDYTLIGANYGVSFCRMSFNPPKKQGYRFVPEYCSVTWTRYGKMFGYMPYFGFQLGVAMGHEGFRFKPDKETGISPTMDGAAEMDMKVIEVPFLAQIHVDSDYFKIMANAGIYGGYRYSVTRYGPSIDPAIADSFRDFDIRFDYGLQGGIGIGLMFDPVEIHFNALVRYSWSSLYEPDYYSQYYYRYAYPFDVMVTAGVHFQLTKRKGRTSHDLKMEAHDIVFNKPLFNNEDTAGKDR